MRKKILLATIFIIFVASIFAIWFIKNSDLADNNTDPSTEASSTTPPVKLEETEICWNMNGVFITDGGSEEAITVTIDGKILEDENGYYKLDANIDLPKGFRYLFGDTKGGMISMNQKNDYLPHLMIFNGFAYHAPSNSSTFVYFGLDLANESLIILFENAPRCYLVASKDPNMDSQQLLEHFKDFIDKEATLAWGFHERFYFTNCRITPSVNYTVHIPDNYRDRLVSQIASATISKNSIDSSKIDPYSVVKASTQYSIDLLTGETISLMYVSVKNSYKPNLTHYLFIGSQAYECVTDLSEVFDELDAYVSSQAKADADTVPDTHPEINTFNSEIQVPTLPIPADNAPKEEWLSFFNGMLGTRGSWYNMALTSYYTNPEEIDLGLFFYNGTKPENAPLTDQEKGFANTVGNPNMNFRRMPATEMDSILNIYFGTELSLYDMSEYKQFHYFEETDCYYFWSNGAHMAEVLGVVDFEKTNDGIFFVSYIHDDGSGNGPAEVVFRRVGDYFQILSNQPLA